MDILEQSAVYKDNIRYPNNAITKSYIKYKKKSIKIWNRLFYYLNFIFITFFYFLGMSKAYFILMSMNLILTVCGQNCCHISWYVFLSIEWTVFRKKPTDSGIVITNSNALRVKMYFTFSVFLFGTCTIGWCLNNYKYFFVKNSKPITI